jgi:hypothetical protein
VLLLGAACRWPVEPSSAGSNLDGEPPHWNDPDTDRGRSCPCAGSAGSCCNRQHQKY